MTEEQLSIQTVQLLYICNKSLVDETVRNDIDVTLNIGHYLGLHRSNDSSQPYSFEWYLRYDFWDY